MKERLSTWAEGNYTIKLGWVWVFFGLNLVFKAAFILFPDVSLDEPFTIFYSQKSLGELFELFEHENNPPLHFLITHFCIKLFGTGPIAVRWFSVLCSSGTAALLFLLGRKYFNGMVAIVATAFFTLTNYHLFVAHEARPYALFGLLAVWSYYLFMGLPSSSGKKTVALLALANVLLVYNHFLGFFIPFSQLLIVLLVKEYRSAWKGFVISGVLSAVLYLPYAFVLIHRILFTADAGGTWVEAPTAMSPYFALWALTNAPLPTILALLAIIMLLVVGLVKKERSSAEKVLWFWWIATFFLMFGISFWFPMFIPKYLIHTSFPFYLLVALGVARLPLASFWKLIVSFVFLIVVGVMLRPMKNDRSISEVGEWLHENKREGILVVLHPDYLDMQLFYHYDRTVFEDYRGFSQAVEEDGFLRVKEGAALDSLAVLEHDEVIGFGLTHPMKLFMDRHYELMEEPQLTHRLNPLLYKKKTDPKHEK